MKNKPKRGWTEIIQVPRDAVMVEVIITGIKRPFQKEQKTKYTWDTHRCPITITLKSRLEDKPCLKRLHY